GEAELGGTDVGINLRGTARAYDRAGHSRIGQRPGNRSLGGRALIKLGNLAQLLDQGQVARETRLLKLFVVLAPVVVGQARDALTRHLAAEQSRLHGRIDDDADIILPTERQNLLLDLAIDERVVRLERT